MSMHRRARPPPVAEKGSASAAQQKGDMRRGSEQGDHFARVKRSARADSRRVLTQEKKKQPIYDEVWLSLVERCVRDAEAAGSNPVTSTSSGAGLNLIEFSAVFIDKQDGGFPSDTRYNACGRTEQGPPWRTLFLFRAKCAHRTSVDRSLHPGRQVEMTPLRITGGFAVLSCALVTGGLKCCLAFLRLWDCPVMKRRVCGLDRIRAFLKKLTTTKTIVLGYAGIILIGALLLMLPFATRAGEVPTTFLNALFTATSATCVTGLIVFDTFTHWTLFGQIVILLLIQIGGVGFMTVAISLVSLTKKKIGVNQRVLMQETVAAPNIGGIVRITRFIIRGSLVFEALGAILLAFYFCPRLGLGEGIYFSIFHSISAFCNAGFDLMGKYQPFSSLTLVADNGYVLGVIMFLIVIGGLGFLVWGDILKCRFRFRQYRLHTKIVLTVSGLLLLIGAAAIFAFEQKGDSFAQKTMGEKILIALFQSVTPRTAGFNTVDLHTLTQSSRLLMIVLMLIGGSPGSTAGGLKTTTFAIVLLSIFSTFRRKKSIECFGRRVDDETLRTASCVMMMYIMLSVGATLIIAYAEGITAQFAMFEVSSAIGTVGLSFGLTPEFGALSKIILICLMFFGRAGSLTILLAFGSGHYNAPSKLPLEKVQIA
jgi:trk system potassium uptake protein TrkH